MIVKAGPHSVIWSYLIPLCPEGVGFVLLPGKQQAHGEPEGEGGAGAGSRDRTSNHCGQSAG